MWQNRHFGERDYVQKMNKFEREKDYVQNIFP